MKVVVIGAGIIGTSIAYHLTNRPEVEVTLLDRSAAGTGASGHSFAWTNAFNKPPRHYHDLSRASMVLWPSLVAELGVPEALVRGGNLLLESSDEGARALEDRVAALQAWEYPCELLDAAGLARLEPGLAEHGFAAACYAPEEGHVDVPAVIAALLARIRAGGATVVEEAGEVSLRQAQDGRVHSVAAGPAVFECDSAVVAAGTATPALVAPFGVLIPAQVSPGIVIRTDPRPRLLQSVSLVHLPAIDALRPEIHLRQLPDGTLQMGQGTQESLDLDDSQAHADDLLARAAHYFPALMAATAIAQPTGYRPMPADGLPVLGFPKAAPNVYVAMMHSGVTLAPLVGRLAAQEVAEGEGAGLAPYRPERSMF